MTEQTSKPELSTGTTFEAFDPTEGHAARVYGVRRSDGTIEGGWIFAGTGVNDRGEFTRVIKMGSDGNYLQKDVSTGVLEAFNVQLATERAKLAGTAIEAAIRRRIDDQPIPEAYIPDDIDRSLYGAEAEAVVKEARRQIDAGEIVE